MIWKRTKKVKIYNKNVQEVTKVSEFYQLQVKYHTGDILVPVLEHTEALKLETQHLVDCLKNGQKPINGGEEGLQVVKILEASDLSLKNSGKETII